MRENFGHDNDIVERIMQNKYLNIVIFLDQKENTIVNEGSQKASEGASGA